MRKSRRSDPVFNNALDHRKDITDSFFGDYGGLPDRLEAMAKSDNSIRQMIRTAMCKSGRLHRLDDLACPFMDQARCMLDEGAVAAVDGTDAVRPIPFLMTCAYVIAVGHITSTMRSSPEILLTETSMSYVEHDRFHAGNLEEVAKLFDELDEIRDDGSWATTFREYCERAYAIKHCPATVILDGPIFTGNLLTQTRGRELYSEMIRDRDRRWIGVIKNISVSYSDTRFYADALETGDAFVVGRIQTQLDKTFADRQDLVQGWIAREIPREFVRVVYRPGLKAFAFECRESELGLVAALLACDASATLHHELPMLLETIDAKLRGAFHSSDVGRAIVNRVSRLDLQTGIDLRDERDLR